MRHVWILVAVMGGSIVMSPTSMHAQAEVGIATAIGAAAIKPFSVRLTKGGHFAAWEQPGAFPPELRTAFRSLRVTE
jgi:hypothetical protein